MTERLRTKAFTLIEVLVVAGIIVLLLAIVLPAVSGVRTQAKRTACLANLRSIAQSSQAYAFEDRRQMVMPMHGVMVRPDEEWLKRTPMWYAWGGRSAPEEFLTPGVNYKLDAAEPSGHWSSKARPLTRYMYPTVSPEEQDLEVFRCPADEGYPDLPQDVAVNDSPRENSERRMYDTVGNSYRGSLAQLLPGSNIHEPAERFSIGVWGQRLDAVPDPSRVIWGGDPLFYNLIGSDFENSWPEVRSYGWHGEFMEDNEAFVDGSARVITAVPKDDPAWAPANGADWGINDAYIRFLTRGPGWQIDCYPRPGVKIGNFDTSAHDGSSWPFKGHSSTPPP